MTSNLLLDRTDRPTVAPPPATTFTALRRDRVADLVRVTSLGVVIVWHSTLSLFHRSHTGVLGMPNPIGSYHGLWLLTWALQVMPLFFIVSGAVNADAWDRHRRRGGTAGSFTSQRVVRFVGPLGVLAGLCAAAELVARGCGYGPFLARHLVILVPLWTLVLLVAYAPATPALARAYERWGISTTAGLVGAVLLSDLCRFHFHVGMAGAVSTLLVWLLAYQLGWVYRSAVRAGADRCRDVGRPMAIVGLVGLVVSTNVGLYPRSMVATSTDAMSNLLPTTVPIAALALLQCGLLLMLRPRLESWLAGERIWRRVEWAGRYALPAYLLHMIAVVALILAAEACGVRFHARPTAAWWLARPLWFAAVLVFLTPLLRVAKRWF
jgi:hypothetical protein